MTEARAAAYSCSAATVRRRFTDAVAAISRFTGSPIFSSAASPNRPKTPLASNSPRSDSGSAASDRGDADAAAVSIRPATAADVPRIAELLAVYVRLRLVRDRPITELQRVHGNFLVAVRGDQVLGCVSLRIYSPPLAEIASLAVDPSAHGLGIGSRLVHAAVLRGHAQGVRRLFAFTTRERLFRQFGFRVVAPEQFPQKLISDYGGLALSAGGKSALLLDLEPGVAPGPVPITFAEKGGGPLRVRTDRDETPLPRPEPQKKERRMAQQQNSRSIAILGGGNLGRALAMGWVEAGYCDADRIHITRRNPDKLTFFSDAGFKVTSSNVKALESADTVIIAVQPQQIEALAKEIRSAIDPDRHRIISVASGVPIRELRELLDSRVSIIRAMPNTAVSIGQSMTCISSSDPEDEALEEAVELFDIVGRTLVIPEDMMIPATALCACGIAFFLRSIRAASQGGIEIGFHPEEALLLAAQTAKGAAMLVLNQGRHPESEIDQVTTPRGCTIAGLNEMEHQGFSSALIKGILLSAAKAETLYSD